MLLERWSVWDIVPGDAGGVLLVKRDTPPWSGKVIVFNRQDDGSLKVGAIIEEQGVPSVCYGTTLALHTMMYMHHGMNHQEHSEARGEKQGAD